VHSLQKQSAKKALEIVGASRKEQIGGVKDKYRFYEKVLNVKDDVATILNSFFPAVVVSAPIRPSAAVSPIPGVRADCGCVDC